MLNNLVNDLCNSLAAWGSIYLFPLMIALFFAALILKTLVQHLLHSLFHFIAEFEKRVHRHVEGDYPQFQAQTDYSILTEELMKKTIHELYEMRTKNLRRKLDKVASFSDRLFMVEEGAKRLVVDTKKEVHYFKYEENPNILASVRFILGINPYFHKLFGFIPLNSITSLMSILPGLFIIGGIFGTFLGITGGLPQLKFIDPANVEGTKSIMAVFLDNMALSLNTSVVGIFFSVVFTLFNTFFSPKNVYQDCTHKMLHSLELLWKDTQAKQKNASHAKHATPTSLSHLNGTNTSNPNHK